MGEADFVSKQTPLARTSDDFSRIEYQLRVALGNPKAKVTNLWAVGNPHLTLNFEKRTSGLLTMEAWVDTTAVEEHNTVRDVCQRGFSFPPDGMIFTTGAMHLNRGVRRSGARQEFLLCKIAVGRSYVLEESILQTSKVELPDGYNSVYIHKNKAAPEGAATDYFHEYLLFDSHQVLPCYLVHFEADGEPDEISKVPVCESCEDAIATVYCQSDSARLCDDCDHKIHSANKLMSRHIRAPLQDQPLLYGKCPEHPNNTVEFFCPLCHVPVCVHCKMVGNHSAGDAATHKLMNIGEAYNSALVASQKEDPLLEARKSHIRNQLRHIDERLRDVNKNSADVEEQIYQILQEALFQLQDETQKKMGILLGEELELRRQLEQIQWTENFLTAQAKSLGPVEYLDAWARHAQVRTELHSAPQTRSGPEVMPDIRCHGKVTILTDDNVYRQGRQSSPLRGENIQVHNQEPTLDALRAAADIPRQASTSFRAQLFGSGVQRSPETAQLNASMNAERHTRETTPVRDASPSPAVKTSELWAETLAQKSREGAYDMSRQENDISRGLRDTNLSESMRGSNGRPPLPGSSPQVLMSLHSMASEARSIKGATGNEARQPFQGSLIIDEKAAETLYYCLPRAPAISTSLLYSGAYYGMSISKLFELCEEKGPTVIIARSGEYIFGGYASSSWNTEKRGFGTEESFLFSLTRDCKIPYKNGKENSACLWASPTMLTFGMVDLVLRDDFSSCTSNLEYSYGIGLQAGSSAAATFLAGSETFAVDDIECWSIV